MGLLVLFAKKKITDLINKIFLYRSDTSSQYWMGAVRDHKDRNNWKWINGEDVTVSFWNLPGGDEDCARYDGSKGWLWSDTNCNAKINYICQHRESIYYFIFY